MPVTNIDLVQSTNTMKMIVIMVMVMVMIMIIVVNNNRATHENRVSGLSGFALEFRTVFEPLI